MNSNTREELLRLADTCIALGGKPRPEVVRLQEMHERLRKAYSLGSKTETDCLIYERMYGHAPEKPSNILKIRYWRTGRSLPSNRKQCHLLAEALELSEPERKFLLQEWCDQCADCFSAESLCREENAECQRQPLQKDSRDDRELLSEKDLYQKRSAYLKNLIKRYLESVPEAHLDGLKIRKERVRAYLRHIYFSDSFHYIEKPGLDGQVLLRHISSVNYDSEFSRQLKLLGEIPRKTMIRHLLLFGLPELTREKLDLGLELLGYLPLSEEHTLTTGERLDWLLIQLLGLYERECAGMEHGEKLVWFQEASRILDAYFAESGWERLRLMHFKAQDL